MADPADKSASPADETKVVVNDAAAIDTAATDRTDASSTSDEGRKTDDKSADAKGIDIVREVLGIDENNQPKEKSPPSPSDKKDGEDKAATADDAAKTDDKKVEDKSSEDDALAQAEKSKFRDDPVFRKVTGELRVARETAEKQAPLVKFASDFGEMLNKTGITPDQLSGTLELVALMNTDPHKAREQIVEVLAGLDKELGYELPADLKKKVDDGDMDLADAQRIAKAEAKARIAADAKAASEKKVETDAKKQDAEKLATTVKRTVEARLSTLASSDPDFSKKEQQLIREVNYLVAQLKKPLASIDDAVRLVNDAYTNVNKFYDELDRGRGGRKPANGGGAETSTTRKTVADLPKTASGLDVTRAALGLI